MFARVDAKSSGPQVRAEVNCKRRFQAVVYRLGLAPLGRVAHPLKVRAVDAPRPARIGGGWFEVGVVMRGACAPLITKSNQSRNSAGTLPPLADSSRMVRLCSQTLSSALPEYPDGPVPAPAPCGFHRRIDADQLHQIDDGRAPVQPVGAGHGIEAVLDIDAGSPWAA